MNIYTLIPIINNALKANKTLVITQASKKIIPFLELLRENNYISSYIIFNQTKVKIFLSYSLKGSPILSLKSISKPSKPITLKYIDLWKFEKSLGLVILSTSKGLMTNQTALKQGIGGKVVAYII